MKNLLLLLLCVSLIFSCGEKKDKTNTKVSENEEMKGEDLQKRVSMDELTYKGIGTNQMMYYESEPFTGIGFQIDENGQLQVEFSYKNGQLRHKVNYKDHLRNGLRQGWYQNGQLRVEENYKDGQLISGSGTCWDEDGNEIDCE